MAIAFDAFAGGSVAAGTSISYSHTCTGSNVVLLCNIVQFGVVDLSGAPTIGGVAMTQIGSEYTWALSRRTSLWYVLNPPSGSSTIAVSFASSANAGMMTASYTGCDILTQPDNSAFQSTSSTSIASNITSVIDNCWHIAFNSGNTTSGTYSAGASTTKRGEQSISTRTMGVYDGNAAISPAAASTLNINCSSTTPLYAVGATLRVYGSTPSSNSNFLALL